MNLPGLRRFLGALLLAAAMSESSLAAADAPRVAVGRITRIDGETVEVGGVQGVLGAGSDIRSDGRSVSAASIRVGMQAQMELDGRGRVLEIRVESTVE
jgi:hypothetical protein